MGIAQNGWTFCFKCQGLFFADTFAKSVCPKDKQPHDGSQSGRYSVEASDSTVPGQGHWKGCSRCQGLYFGGDNSPTFCPAHNPSVPNDPPGHSDVGSGDYTLNYYQLSGSRAAGQPGWRWCSQCQGLFFGAGGLGSCPIRPGAQHAFGPDNFNYVVKWENPLAGSEQGPQLLIVTPQAFRAALQPLVNHKNATGMTSLMVTIEALEGACDGIDVPERIKRGVWQAFVNLNIQYVLLVGDASVFPVRYRFVAQMQGASVGGQSGWMDGSYNPTDLYYANLVKAGNQFDDWDADGDGKYDVSTWGVDPYSSPNQNPDDVTGYPDVALGRLPAHSADEVTRYVNKVIRYETGQMAGQNEVTFLEDVAYDNPPTLSRNVFQASLGIGNNRTVNFVALEYGDTPPGDPWTLGGPTTIDYVGVTRSWWISYIGHGGNLSWGYAVDLYDSTHVFGDLINKFNLPIVFCAACSTGAFAPTAPIGEYMGNDGLHSFLYFDDSKMVVDVNSEVPQGVCPKDNGRHALQPHTYFVDFTGPGVPGQGGWKWCKRCEAMFFAGNGLAATHCPAYDKNNPISSPYHDPTGSGDYSLNFGSTVPGQKGWRWCVQCQGLFYGLNDGGSCPAVPGSPHKAPAQPTDYAVKTTSDKSVGVQLGWCWCEKCQGLYFAGPLKQWDFSQPRPPIAIPPPRALDYVSGAQRTFAHAWLFNANEGGGIAYLGENLVMEDGNGTELEGYVLNEYVKGARVLGDIWLSAQRRYYENFLTSPGALDYNFTSPRIYLGIMELFGDPSLRL